MGTSAKNWLKGFDRVAHISLPHNIKSYDIFWKLFSSFLSGKELLIHLGINSSSEWAINAGVSRSSSFEPTISLSCINDLFDDIIFMILVSTQNVTKQFACGNKLRRPLSRNFMLKTQWSWVKGVLRIQILEKLSFLHLNSHLTLVQLMWEWMMRLCFLTC